ncbi:hypothetical protein L1887_28662 [Cichorium endivia]|nr:hypothetical protein L1887_28662 [Cichorium endivia]
MFGQIIRNIKVFTASFEKVVWEIKLGWHDGQTAKRLSGVGKRRRARGLHGSHLAFARLLFPSEAKLAMEIANAQTTSAYPSLLATKGSNGN